MTKASILVVDDSATIRSVTKNFLEENNYTVETAVDGLDALEKISSNIPDLILLDLEMPRMDGFKFAEEIRQDPKYANIPIIIITYRTGAEHKQHAQTLGIEGFLAKPFHENELLDEIEILLSQS